MRSVFTLLLFCLSLSAFAQKEEPKNVYFLTNKGRYLEVLDSADYIRVVKMPDSGSVLYNVTEFYKSGKPKLIGKSTKIDPPWYEGQTVAFYENGRRKNTLSYKQGRLSGDAFEYYPNGRLYWALTYPDPEKKDTTFKNGYKITTSSDSLGNGGVADGNGYYKGYDDKFKYVNEEGWIKAGLRDSIWKGKSLEQKLTFEELYKNGKLVKGIVVDSTGTMSDYKDSRMTFPRFTKGESGFGQFLVRTMRYPETERRNNIQGVVVLGFVVERDGRLTDIKVNKSAGKGLDEEAVRVMKISPLWTPGTMYGKPIRVNYTVPISFRLQ
ncbi:TonB family protein [Mucilaginibacter terrenus]|uniref:TonB family protein n=1 Tax=Mucilaginibacter terrenus TaxID=2482727 RepID=A0A3E2NPG6_9SPHI|nr:energy transducer TonB [Mucilaginibacter terrenus]RFZ82853.1 TonB family protein [Mucilaginibacter terrenus]